MKQENYYSMPIDRYNAMLDEMDTLKLRLQSTGRIDVGVTLNSYRFYPRNHLDGTESGVEYMRRRRADMCVYYSQESAFTTQLKDIIRQHEEAIEHITTAECELEAEYDKMYSSMSILEFIRFKRRKK